VLGPSDGGLGGQDAPDGFPASGCNAYPSRAKAFFADAFGRNTADPSAAFSSGTKYIANSVVWYISRNLS